MLRQLTLVSVLAVTPVSFAFADSCEFEHQVKRQFETADFTLAELHTIAGDVQVYGHDNDEPARLEAQICASSQKLLDSIQFESEIQGKTLFIKGEKPDSNWSWGDHYAYIDIELHLPSQTALKLSDRSGSVQIQGIHGGLEVWDRSGSLSLENTAGDLKLSDRSGDVEIVGHNGSVLIEQDRSGDIDIRNVTGSVEIKEDRSGEINIEHVSQDVLIGSDRSGDINVFDVEGDLIVERDGSGDIDYSRVRGNVAIPSNKR